MINALLRIINFFVPARWYIVHEDWESSRLYVEKNYFGPFTARQIGARITDEYAELLEYGEDKVGVVKLSWLEARQIPFIASRKFWDNQVEALADDEVEAAWASEEDL